LSAQKSEAIILGFRGAIGLDISESFVNEKLLTKSIVRILKHRGDGQKFEPIKAIKPDFYCFSIYVEDFIAAKAL